MTAIADVRPLTAAPQPSRRPVASSRASRVSNRPSGRVDHALTDALTDLAEGEGLPASFVTDLVATRPPGGKRRAEGARTSRRRPDGEARGKRARRDTAEGVLVDASDAAGRLAMASDFWDANQVLAHAEVARMALGEALADLAAEREKIGSPGLSRRKRRTVADIERREAALVRAHALLSEAHARHLVVGD